MKTVADSNEAVRCEYISTILHACIRIVKKLTRKEISLNPQLEVIGEESGGHVDYAIKCIEELIAIKRENNIKSLLALLRWLTWSWCHYSHGLVLSSEGISCTSEVEYRISLTKAIAKEENEAELRKSVKQVMEVIIGLLKDRVDVKKEPMKKKARVQEYLK